MRYVENTEHKKYSQWLSIKKEKVERMFKVNDKKYENLEEATRAAGETGAPIMKYSKVLGAYIEIQGATKNIDKTAENVNKAVENVNKTPKTKASQLKAVAKYDAAHRAELKIVTFKLKRDSDQDIIEALEKSGNASEMIKDAIRKYIN